MSPNIEWRIGEEAGEETIVKTPSRRPRWRKVLMLIAISLGIGLGIIYRSIPEPSARLIAPTPLPPTPTLDPSSLEAVIERNVYNLATDAGESQFDLALTGIESTADEDYADWYYTLLSAGGRWGVSAPDGLYTIEQIASGGVTAWADVRQWRGTGYFRQVRFYRFEDNRWQMTLPVANFWSGKMRAIDTSALSNTVGTGVIPFDLAYPFEDEAYVPAVANRFSRVFKQLCADLHCPTDRAWNLTWGNDIALTVTIRPGRSYQIKDDGQHVTVQMPSPRIIGVYETADSPNDPVRAIAFDSLLAPAARLASGDARRWAVDRGGQLFLDAIVNWQRQRVAFAQRPMGIFFAGPIGGLTRPPSPLSNITSQAYYAGLLSDQPQVPLNALWNWNQNENRLFGALGGYAVDQANAVIALIGERYGDAGVIKFLNALGASHALEEAIGRGLDWKYSDFLVAWRKWISYRD